MLDCEANDGIELYWIVQRRPPISISFWVE
jgi:hypothetical protein